MTQEFYKLLHPGLVDIGLRPLAAVFVEVEYSADGKLSLTAVEGPLASGSCLGS